MVLRPYTSIFGILKLGLGGALPLDETGKKKSNCGLTMCAYVVFERTDTGVVRQKITGWDKKQNMC